MELSETIVIISDDDSFKSTDESTDESTDMNEKDKLVKCPRCLRMYPSENGITLKACNHSICKECIVDHFFKNQNLNLKCEFKVAGHKCNKIVSPSEIRLVLTEVGIEQASPLRLSQPTSKKAAESCEFYLLTMMEELSFVKNSDAFDCPICFVPCNAQEGIMLRDCLHEFCLECITNTVTYSEDEPIKCPYTDENLSHCDSCIQEREIRAVVPKEIYNKFLDKKLKFAEHSIKNTFHCKTVDCPGFGIIEEGDVVMMCAICNQRNCLQCKAIHKDQSCEEYQDSLTGSFKVTEKYINQLKDLGNVMNCPKCQALIDKIAGCSWVQCTFCKTEICWPTKGPRWGPQGRGDLSGGCRCKINGIKCHPNCENCH